MRGGLQSPCGCRILPPDSQLGAVIATAQPPPRARESATSPVVATVVQEILRPFPPNPPRNRGLFSPRDTLPTSDLNTALQLYAWRIVALSFGALSLQLYAWRIGGQFETGAVT